MAGAVLSFPYMGILAILLKTMTLEADALTAWDCSRDGLKSRTVYLKDLSEGEKVFLESMRMYLGVEYPDEFAYKIKRVPGYTAIIEEDKFHIIQCEPVVALLLPQDKCYDRLQIVYHDNIYFLTPWTHIITETANEIPCNAPNLRDYELEGSTYKILSRPGVSLEPRRDKNFEEDPVNSSPKLTPKETEYRRRRNIGGIDTVSTESIQSYMYRLEHPELDQEPRRDKNFEEDPENSSPKLTPKYKETEYQRRRNIGGIDTVSTESIQSYMYRLEHPELDQEPRRDKNFEEDPENSSPKLTPKYKETEYQRRRNIGGIDTVSTESIQSYMYRLEHPELDQEPRRNKNFEEDPENSSPKLTPKYKETEYQRRRNIGGIDTVSTESIQSYMYRLQHPELDQEPRRDKNFEEDPENSSPKLTPKETEYRRRRNIGGIDTVSTESIQSYMYRLEHPELDQEPRRDKNFEEDPENSSPKLTPKYKETEYQRRRNIGGIDTVSTESIQSYMYRLKHPELDQEPRRDKNFEEDPENSSPKLTPKETEYRRRRNIGGIDTVSKEPIESYMYRLEHPELDLEPRRDKNFEEDPENSSPKLTPKYKETEYQRRRNIGGIDTVSTESIQSYMYRLKHPELDQEPRRDKNFEEDPENSSPNITLKYKETEYQRRRNIGEIDTVSKESIQSYIYRLEHPELDLEPRRDKNFEEDPENSSPKYKETEYQRRRNIGGIDTVSTESIQSYMYRLEHPELDGWGQNSTKKP